MIQTIKNRIIYMETRGPEQILFQVGSPGAPEQLESQSGGVDRESVQALEVAQNPRLTAKETSQTTATQKLDPMQPRASEGPSKFVQITKDETA